MTGRKFMVLIAVIFLITAAFYFTTMPRGSDVVLVGVVDGNEVIVSPQITGRITTLAVDEGTAVKKGDLIAELDPRELEAGLGASKANVLSLEAQVNEANHNFAFTDTQTDASVVQQQRRITMAKAQLEPARAPNAGPRVPAAPPRASASPPLRCWARRAAARSASAVRRSP